MIDFLILGKSNSYGLTRDARLLQDAIEAMGSTCAYATTKDRGLIERLLKRRRARCVIHLERAFPAWFSAGEENWLIPNQERFPKRHLPRLKHIDRVLAKTRHAAAIFSALGVKTDYLGFTSEDRRLANQEPNFSHFFHLAGGSTLKGTEDIVELWTRNPSWPELVLVQKAENAPKQLPANIRLISGYLDDQNLQLLQNQCGVHLCPSRAEGWGHHIVEALSVGAITLTVDAPPMNEHISPVCGVLVPFGHSEPRHLGTCFHADIMAMEILIEDLMAETEFRKLNLSKQARARFEAIDQAFKMRVRDIFRRAIVPVPSPDQWQSARHP